MESKEKEKKEKKKNGLKGLFEEIEAEKKKKKIKNKKQNDSNKNTKTKPDFSKISNSSSDFKGLKNFGNSCYSNVIIQILTSIPEFINVLYRRYSIVENENDLFLDYPILSRIMEIMSNYKSKNTSLASNYLKEIVNKFDSSGNQNDAHEFLVFLLDRLNNELLNIENKYKIINDANDINNNNLDKNNIKEEPKESSNDDEGEWEEVKKGGKTMKQTNSIKNFKTSILGEVFQGILKQDIIQKGNSKSNCQIEPFFTLHLDNEEPSIENMFEKFFKKKINRR